MCAVFYLGEVIPALTVSAQQAASTSLRVTLRNSALRIMRGASFTHIASQAVAGGHYDSEEYPEGRAFHLGLSRLGAP